MNKRCCFLRKVPREGGGRADPIVQRGTAGSAAPAVLRERREKELRKTTGTPDRFPLRAGSVRPVIAREEREHPLLFDPLPLLEMRTGFLFFGLVFFFPFSSPHFHNKFKRERLGRGGRGWASSRARCEAAAHMCRKTTNLSGVMFARVPFASAAQWQLFRNRST